jgi:RNA polymerase sigma factor (sigma-70 family)
VTNPTPLNDPDGEPVASDSELLERARKGDNDAFAELWRRHAGAARAVAISFSPSFDPDDLVSESFVKIYKAVNAGNGPTAGFRPYLLSTVRNLAVDWSKARREVPLENMALFEDTKFSESSMNDDFDKSLTVRAFEALPKRWQEVIWYTEIERMPPQQLAPILGVSANSIAALAYRAREGLRQAWVQAHLQARPEDEACRWVIERLGAYSRGGLGKADTTRVREHLEDCDTCPLVLVEAEGVAARIAFVLLPFLLGAIAGGWYLAWIGTGKQAAQTGMALTAMPSRITGGRKVDASGANRLAGASHNMAAASIPSAAPGATVSTPALAALTSGIAAAASGVSVGVWIAAAVVVVSLAAGGALAASFGSLRPPTSTSTSTSTSSPVPHGPNAATTNKVDFEPPSSSYVAPTTAQVSELPDATYDAVIGGLINYDTAAIPSAARASYRLSADTALFGANAAVPIAKLTAKNFLHQDTVVVPVEFSGNWALVLTPSRQQLPSADGGNAPAQSAAWVRVSALHKVSALKEHIVLSLRAQRLSIVDRKGTVIKSFTVGIGTSSTPTPDDVVGYIEARYLDPAQGEARYPIQLTSLHSAADDEPFEGEDGGLIGIHYQSVDRGAVSHGCVRLSAVAIAAVDKLPVGSLISIQP